MAFGSFITRSGCLQTSINDPETLLYSAIHASGAPQLSLQLLPSWPQNAAATFLGAAIAASRATDTYAPGRCSCCFRCGAATAASVAALLQRLWKLQCCFRSKERFWNGRGRCNSYFCMEIVPAILRLMQCSPTLQMLLQESQHAPPTLPYAATAAYSVSKRSIKASVRCNCFFQSHRTLQQFSWTLQLLQAFRLRASLKRSQTLQLVRPEPQDPGATTAASRATGRSCNAYEPCSCCFQNLRLYMRRFHTP